MRYCIFLVLAFLACAPQDTGGQLVSFHAYVRGRTAGPVAFDNGEGFHVELTAARLYVGAMYFRAGTTNSGDANSSCVSSLVYAGQVPGPGDIDVLSTQLREMSVLGNATTDLAQSAEIWLFEGDINQTASSRVVASVAGTVTRDGASHPFRGSITIGQNHVIPPSNPAQPGANPICKSRIITPIPVSLRPTVGGDLLLEVDPATWLRDVDFSVLTPDGDGDLVIPDLSSGTGTDVVAGRSFYQGVTGASAATYDFSWFVP